MTTTIQAFEAKHRQWLLDLNQANLPEVSSLGEADLEALIPKQYALQIALIEGKPAGAVFLMQPGQDYASSNYQWFCQSGEAFLYVDRIMVDAAFRGFGLGKALYAEAGRIAGLCGAPRITCEINTLPPNPKSFAFHEKMGFRGIIERDSDGGKRVMMMEKRLL